MKYKDIRQFRTDEKFVEYSSSLLTDLESKPLEVLESRIYMEMNRCISDVRKHKKIHSRRRELMKLLLSQYNKRTKPEDIDPIYRKAMVLLGMFDENIPERKFEPEGEF